MRILFIIILLWTETVLAQNLFQAPSAAFRGQTDLILPEESSVLRKRGVDINTSEVFKSLNKKEPLVLNLFPDVEMKAVIKESRTLEEGGTFSSGKLEDGGFMTMYISKEGIIRGEVHSARGVYTIRSGKGNKNQVIIREVDMSQIPRGDDVRTIDPELLKNFSRENVKKKFQLRESLQESQTLPESQTVDVLVLYTTRAKNSEGGATGIKATIEGEINKTNKALRDSGLSNKQINLVGIIEVNYTQHSEKMGTDLKYLVFEREDQYSDNSKPDPTGIMDEVHQWRDQYGADLVHLFVRDATNVCGVAYVYNLRVEQVNREWCEDNYAEDYQNYQECISEERVIEWRDTTDFTPSTSFSVSAIQSCPAGYTFAHELGHNMGLFHDRFTVREKAKQVIREACEKQHPDRVDECFLQSYPSHLERSFGSYKPYAFGYVNQNFNRPVCWRTIMAYSNQCIDEGFSYESRNVGIVPYFSKPSLHLRLPNEQSNDPAGVSGSNRTTSLTGPVNASRAINDVWNDILIRLKSSSKSCQNTIFANPKNLDNSNLNLEQPIPISVSGGVKSFRLSDIPEYCDTLITAESSENFISVSTEKITNSDDSIDFQVDITLNRISGDSRCSGRQGSITLKGDAGAEKTISIVQGTQTNLEPVQSLICERAGSEPLNQLELLDLSNQNVSALSQSSFEGLTNLEELNLSQNSIRALPSQTFLFLNSLKELNLSENQINSISSNAFNSLSSLEELDLNQNQLNTLPSDVFSGLVRLKSLDLSSNSISALSHNIFSTLTRLRELDLSRNQISSIPSNIFSNLSTLRYLWLNSNSITTLSSSVFSQLSSLRALALDENKLTAMPVGIFSNLSNLRYLWLNANNLNTLPENIFSGLSRLRYLSLSTNSLSAPLSDGVCSFLQDLRYLVIKGEKSLNTLCPTGGGVRSLFKIFSFDSPTGQHFGKSQTWDLIEAEYNPKVILKLRENGIRPSDISQITGVSEHEIKEIIVNSSLRNY